MGRFLRIRSKGTSYESLYYYLRTASYHALRRCGADVDVFDESKSANIRIFTGKSYDAIIDFNSNMPDKRTFDYGTPVIKRSLTGHSLIIFLIIHCISMISYHKMYHSQADTNLTMEDAMTRFLETREKKIPDKIFRQFMHYYHMADAARR